MTAGLPAGNLLRVPAGNAVTRNTLESSMQWKFVAVLSLTLASAASAQTTSPNWLQEFLLVGATQTKVVRHPLDRTRYYLCWQEGTSRYGLAFRRGTLDGKLKAMKPGSSASLSTMVSASQSRWTAADERVCWGAPT